MIEMFGALMDLPVVALLSVLVALPLIGRAAIWVNRRRGQ